MPRFVRNWVVAAAVESTYGTDIVPSAATAAILASKPRITPINANTVSRDLVRPYFGGAEQLVGTRSVTCEFSVELAGSGAAGTAPKFDALLRGCALAKTTIASTRVDYLPITGSQESVSIYWYDDGLLHKLIGARGTVKLDLTAGNIPTMAFVFTGLYAAPTAATPATADFTGFITPLVVTDANAGDITIGGTVASTGAPAIAGGTIYPSMGLEMDVGNTVQFNPMLGGEAVDITQRVTTGKARLDLTAAQEVTIHGFVAANTPQAISLQHGTAAGNKVLLHQPNAQLFSIDKDEINGRRLSAIGTRANPVTGNDEFRLVFY